MHGLNIPIPKILQGYSLGRSETQKNCLDTFAIVFKLRGGASRTRRVGRSVCRSVGRSVGPWKILTNVLNRGKPYVSLRKPYVSLCKLT